MVIGWTHIVFQIDAVLEVVREVTLRLKLVDPVEAIIAPALTDFKLTLVDAEHHLRWSQVIN